jgi:hypothetical protein
VAEITDSDRNDEFMQVVDRLQSLDSGDSGDTEITVVPVDENEESVEILDDLPLSNPDRTNWEGE